MVNGGVVNVSEYRFQTSDVMLFPRMTKCLKYRISLHCVEVNTNSNHK